MQCARRSLPVCRTGIRYQYDLHRLQRRQNTDTAMPSAQASARHRDAEFMFLAPPAIDVTLIAAAARITQIGHGSRISASHVARSAAYYRHYFI